MKREELTTCVVSWNARFPMDRWWRKKYNVPFMSPTHRESSFIAQLIEFEEDKMFEKMFHTDKEASEKYVPGVGDLFKTPGTLEDFTKEAEREIEEMLKLENNGR